MLGTIANTRKRLGQTFISVQRRARKAAYAYSEEMPIPRKGGCATSLYNRQIRQAKSYSAGA